MYIAWIYIRELPCSGPSFVVREMENDTIVLYSPPYESCYDPKLSNDSITSEYWNAADVKPELKIVTAFTATVLLLYLVVGLPSNVILIISIISKHLKEPTHILLLNLAISDMLVCTIFMPFGIVSGYAGGFIFGSNDQMRCQLCQFVGLVFTALSVTSLNTLGLISMDRFLYIKFPLSYPRYVTASKTVFIIILVWLFSVLQSVPPLFGFGSIRYSYWTSLCLIRFYGRTSVTENAYFVLLVILALIPMVVMLVTNAWIIIIVRIQIKKLYKTRRSFGNKRQLQNHQQSMRTEINKAKNKKQLALFKAFGTILIANMITWVPLIILAAISTGRNYDVPFGFYTFVFLTFTSHSILHPIIEGCFIPELKKDFRKVLCPCNKRDRTSINIDAVDDDGRSYCCLRYLDVCSFALLYGSQDVIDTASSHTSEGNHSNSVTRDS